MHVHVSSVLTEGALSKYSFSVFLFDALKTFHLITGEIDILNVWIMCFYIINGIHSSVFHALLYSLELN